MTMFRKRYEHKLDRSVTLTPEDTLICDVETEDDQGNAVHERFVERFDHHQDVNTVATFDVEDEMGFESGVAAVFGDKVKNR
jgi:hypothetical protein